MSRYNLPRNFINRELSWLEFNQLVLDEAKDTNKPLFERLKFAGIVSSNLDEFFMVRVGSLYSQIELGFNKEDASGLTPIQQMEQIATRSHKLVKDQVNSFIYSLKLALKKQKILILKPKELSEKQISYIKEYYLNNIYPVLTPMVVDSSRPFPLILNRSLNIALLLKDKSNKGEHIFATIQVPSVLGRLIEVPYKNGHAFILLEDVIKMELESLLSGYNIQYSGCYRITRNADLSLDEEGAEDLLEAIEESLKQRKWGVAVRIEIEKGINEKLLHILEKELEISKKQEYEINGPIDLTFLLSLAEMKGYDNLRYDPLKPVLPGIFHKNHNIFEIIAKGDILLHHPYESFQPIIDLVEQSAEDPNVLAIKQTLYRVSENSPIIAALAKAAENGKQVTVLVELKARFDEEKNIHWARRLEKAGCHVIYGLVGLKTHCKLLLVVRKEEEGIKRYIHMGTGNYNDQTAMFYSDIGLLTADPIFGQDASAVFNMLSGHSKPESLSKMTIAPLFLRAKLLGLINAEIENVKKGNKALIILKMNSLVDKEIIEALYAASSAGVEIQLIIRGICCLRPGIPGISEDITVRSIVGRFLEHSRIFYFYNNGDESVYLSSADCMNRNLDRRVELFFPINSKEIKEKVKHFLTISLKDTTNARNLNFSGKYTRVDKRKKIHFNSQMEFYKIALSGDSKQKSHNESNNDFSIEGAFKPILSSEAATAADKI
jgi:polyphosphate kinase